MRYVGGKSRIAKPISTIINSAFTEEEKRKRDFVSLFCGGGAIEAKIEGFKSLTCNDIHPYLIAMFQEWQAGRKFPDEISEEEYAYIRTHKDEDKALTGLVGFGCSFGGKFFGGYGRSGYGRSCLSETRRSLTKEFDGSLQNARFICQDYREVYLPEHCVIYCDPPYKGTTHYRGVERFDSEAFWNYMRKISAEHVVFISELNAPDDFVAIWEKPFLRQIDRNKDNQFISMEKLFVHKANENKIFLNRNHAI